MAPLAKPTADASSVFLQELSNEPQPGMYPQGIVLIVLSGLAILLDIPPLIWHIAKRNMAVVALITWLILLNTMNFVNVFIWPNDNLPSRWEGTGLCDVEVKLQLGSYVALPGALACIMRTLVAVLDTNSANIVPSAGKRRRNTAFTLIFCFGLPVYVMAMHYIVQPNRYAVWAISGCNPTTDGSWLSLFLILLWPVMLSAVDTYYAIFLIFRMQKYRAEFSRLLQNSNTTRARFLRLFIISLTLTMIVTPVQIYILFRNVEGGIRRFSWSRTHGDDWQLVTPVPAQGQVLFDRWIRVAAGFVVFAFFGVGADATRMYRGWASKLGLIRFSSTPTTESSSTSNKSWHSWLGFSSKVKAWTSPGHCARSHEDNAMSPVKSFSTSSQSTQEKGLFSAQTPTERSESISDAFDGSFLRDPSNEDSNLQERIGSNGY